MSEEIIYSNLETKVSCTENLNCPYCSITFGGFLYDSDPAGCELVQECCDALGGTVVVVPPPFPGGSNRCRCAFVTPRLPGTECSSTADIVLVCDHPEFQQRIIDSDTYNSVNRSGYCCNGYCEPNPCI